MVIISEGQNRSMYAFHVQIRSNKYGTKHSDDALSTVPIGAIPLFSINTFDGGESNLLDATNSYSHHANYSQVMFGLVY